MICSRCLRSLAVHRSSARLFSSTPAAPASVFAKPRGTPSSDHEGPPAATSKGDAQPFSTPLTPAPSTASVQSESEARKPHPASSAKAGTPLKGLAWLKGKEPPVAKEDYEYPDWLWTILDQEKKTKSKAATAVQSSEYSGTRKSRQRARKEAAKIQRDNLEDLEPSVPLEQQSINLPSGDGTLDGALHAFGARQDLTQAMRQARKKAIKEANFLKSMR